MPSYFIPLHKSMFSDQSRTIVQSDSISVTSKTYPSGIESIQISNSRGYVEVLPFLGQIIWDLTFDGVSLRMKNSFPEPRRATSIVDTYGCFAFHSGLLAAGCPAPEDNHELHGEFACAEYEQAWLEIGETYVSISGRYEYVKGFGHHYEAIPTVRLRPDATEIEIELKVKNLSESQMMPLQYMCHMNYRYAENGSFGGNIPKTVFKVRNSIPAHVIPTEPWKEFINELAFLESYDQLIEPSRYDPEIVWFADDLPQYGKDIEVTMDDYFTRFNSEEFPVATRWILHNADQQVAAFVLPGTSRPEGFKAAERAGTLIKLAPGEGRTFHVTTGIKAGA